MATRVSYATDWIVWYTFANHPQGMSSPAIAENSYGHEGPVVLSVGRPSGKAFEVENHPTHNGLQFGSWEEAQEYAFENGLLKRGDGKVSAEKLARVHSIEEIDAITEQMTGESQATLAVIRALCGDKKMGLEYWEAMTYSSLEAFVNSAKLILGDATEIEGRHLENADWFAIYEEFKGKK